jgi:myo-inositol-1(or 4)-monophosphatase
MTETLRDYLDFAIDVAWQAGQLTLGYFQTGIRPNFKADDSPVTMADREAEKLIRSRIEQHFPDHVVIGEEFGGKELLSKSDGPTHRWIVDPIDGTRSFVRGVPLYAVLIALEIEGKCEVGVAHFPALGEMIAAATGEGCWWNGRRAQVSEVADLKDALLAHSDAGNFKNYDRQAAWERLQAATQYRAGWCDAYGYLLVATGRADIMVDPIMNEWDCGPFIPILQEAGGYFGDWQGKPTIYSNEAMATTQKLLPQVLKTIKG